jgi:hypothetical protein
MITRGTLPSIVMTKNGSDVLVTDLSLGGLMIGESTTVAQFSAAVIAGNDDYVNGDQLTFFYGVQLVDAVTGVPRAKITGYKMLLDTQDTTPLWNVVTALGFSSVSDGHGGTVLGMNSVITNGAAAWIHSREDAGGDLTVSTQYLYVDSAILASYQDENAFGASAQSYGGINTSAVYLDPGSTMAQMTPSVTPSGEDSGSETGGNTNPSNGSDPQTVTVTAPTFSGETQFDSSTQVSMSAENGAAIYYTLDGSEPTSASTLYSAPVTLTDTTTVKAVAVKDGVTSSVTERTYTKGSGGGDGTDFD